MHTLPGRLPEALVSALTARGYLDLTPVQRAVLSVMPPDADLLVSAPTGSGKTLAYGLAIVRDLLTAGVPDTGRPEPRALVLAPTRELAAQIGGELAWLGADAGIRVGVCTGGTPLAVERRMLRRGVHVLSATPGRLRAHFAAGALPASRIGHVVVDEADEMLRAGFLPDIEAILGRVGTERRTVLVSATVPPTVELLSLRYQRDRVRLALNGRVGPAVRAVLIDPGDRDAAVATLLRRHDARVAIVFCGRREVVADLSAWLAGRGFRAVALSGALDQAARASALAALRGGAARVCISTDLVARGLDLPSVDLVIHADLPRSPEALIHRSGRTGRAGQEGMSVLLVPHRDRRRAEEIARKAGLALIWISLPGAEASGCGDSDRISRDPHPSSPASPEDIRLVADLLARHNSESLARALAALWRHSMWMPTPMDMRRIPAADATRGSHWFEIDYGSQHGADPRHVLALVTGMVGIARAMIGRIHVKRRSSRFEVAAPALPAIERSARVAGKPGTRIRPVCG